MRIGDRTLRRLAALREMGYGENSSDTIRQAVDEVFIRVALSRDSKP